MREMAGKDGERRLSEVGMEQMLVSMGHQACGAVKLWNYPSWMRSLVAHDINGEDRPDQVDMAAMESQSLAHSNHLHFVISFLHQALASFPHNPSVNIKFLLISL
jgi:hypothetical protein